jgi:hypothetical protein
LPGTVKGLRLGKGFCNARHVLLLIESLTSCAECGGYDLG